MLVKSFNNSERSDLKLMKKKLRNKLISKRENMIELQKNVFDNKIYENFINLKEYIDSDVILTYVSTDIEVDTRKIIKKCISDGKKVAVPRCVPATRVIEFYYITSISEMETGTFDILEPKANKLKLYDKSDRGTCIVPALCYNLEGYRIGYGGGYYDRFLSDFQGHTVGVCYDDFVFDEIPHNKYDVPVKKIVTEKLSYNI